MSSSHLPPFAALRAFDAVGQTGGIRRAAEMLGLSHAIISRHIAALEQDLGETLLDRRSGALTPAGRAYHARISAAIREMQAATDALRAASRASLTIWCSAGFSLHWLARRLPEFAGQWGGPVVDLQSSDSEPDFSRGQADGDIRYRLDSDPTPIPRDVRAEELARPPVFPVVAPEMLPRMPVGAAMPEALMAQPLIQEGAGEEWRDWLRAQGRADVAIPAPVARFGQAHLALAAARAGQGVALSNPLLAGEDLASGRLVAVPGAAAVALGAYDFRCPAGQWNHTPIRRLRQWLKSSLSG